MSAGSDGIGAAIRALWAREHAEMLRRLEAIDCALTALARNELAADIRAGGEQAAHKIAGSAGTFGFPEASAHARAIEMALRNGASAADAAALAQRAASIRADF